MLICARLSSSGNSSTVLTKTSPLVQRFPAIFASSEYICLGVIVFLASLKYSYGSRATLMPPVHIPLLAAR